MGQIHLIILEIFRVKRNFLSLNVHRNYNSHSTQICKLTTMIARQQFIVMGWLYTVYTTKEPIKSSIHEISSNYFDRVSIEQNQPSPENGINSLSQEKKTLNSWINPFKITLDRNLPKPTTELESSGCSLVFW